MLLTKHALQHAAAAALADTEAWNSTTYVEQLMYELEHSCTSLTST